MKTHKINCIGDIQEILQNQIAHEKIFTLMVSRANSITAHCLGDKALASSRTMCSCQGRIHTIYFSSYAILPQKYSSHQVTFSLESWPSSLAALKISCVPWRKRQNTQNRDRRDKERTVVRLCSSMRKNKTQNEIANKHLNQSLKSNAQCFSHTDTVYRMQQETVNIAIQRGHNSQNCTDRES